MRFNHSTKDTGADIIHKGNKFLFIFSKLPYENKFTKIMIREVLPSTMTILANVVYSVNMIF